MRERGDPSGFVEMLSGLNLQINTRVSVRGCWPKTRLAPKDDGWVDINSADNKNLIISFFSLHYNQNEYDPE